MRQETGETNKHEALRTRDARKRRKSSTSHVASCVILVSRILMRCARSTDINTHIYSSFVLKIGYGLGLLAPLEMLVTLGMDVTNTGNGERGTGVWELMYSGNPLENSKWRSKQKKRLEEKQFRLRWVSTGCAPDGQYVLVRTQSD